MQSTNQKRFLIIQNVVIATAVLLILKVASLQLFDTSYSQQADARTLERKVLYPSRGLIYDRTGKLLVYNNAIYDITALYSKIDPEMDTSEFCGLLGIEKARFVSSLEKNWGSRYSKAVPFTFEKQVDPVTFASFQEHMYEYPGFSSVLRNVRGYRFPNAAHVLGYISEVDQNTVENSEGEYTLGDYIGTSGIEKQYESELKGQKGVSYVLKDNLGRELSNDKLGQLDSAAISGTDIQLTLDIDLQAYGELLFQGKKGSAVAIEPKTGEILAMISAPSYDPEALTIHQGRSRAFNALMSDTLNPFFDRSVMAAYAPGSIFKPVLALIAMQEGVLEPNRHIFCDGAYHYRHFSYGCHEHPQPENLSIGLAHSCNSYFFQTFRDVMEKEGFTRVDRGLRTINSYLEAFGLGQTLGVDLPQEKTGFIPGADFYDEMYGKNVWRSTYILSLGIGQGEIQLTTLQMANLAAIIANRGYFVTPHLIGRYVNTLKLIPDQYKTAHKVPVDEQYFEPVIEGMSQAVTWGTATTAYHPEIEICGKTGTSQNPHGKDHSVFFAFAPKDDPQIAIAVYVENAGWGGTYAAPMASLMIEKYLNKTILPNRKWIENRILEADLITKP